MSSNTSHRFSWNAGAIAGSAIGASFWMPTTALASGWPARGFAVALAAAALILISAYVLWQVRPRISAFQGLMILLAVGFAASLAFFLAAHILDLSIVDGWPGGKRSAPLDYVWVLLLYPALAVWFYYQNRHASDQKPRTE
jgi:hypothetical protein